MGQTFMGLKVVQTWVDLGIWELFFDTYPIRTFIELAGGALMLLLLIGYFQLTCFSDDDLIHIDDGA